MANAAAQHLLGVCKMESNNGSQRKFNRYLLSKTNIVKCCNLRRFIVNPFFQTFVRKPKGKNLKFRKSWVLNVFWSFSQIRIPLILFQHFKDS